MKHWKKYLAAAGTGCILLALIIALNNNSGKKDTTALKSAPPVNESLQTVEVNNSRQEDNIVMAENAGTTDVEAADSAESKIVSKEDINSEIDQLINTYYNVSDNTDTASNKTDAESNKSDAGNSDKDNSGKTGQAEDKQTSEKKTSDTQAAKIDPAKKQTDEKQTANDKSDATEKKNDIVEGYKNIKNYVKPGLDKNSYVVFTTYDIKLYNINTLVPGMSSLSVVRDENGALVINKDISDAKLKKHIQKLSEEKDIKKVISKVNTKLTAAVKKDAALKGFIDYLE
jgi:hypothetical protein